MRGGKGNAPPRCEHTALSSSTHKCWCVPAQGSVSGERVSQISKQVRNKMGRVTNQLLQTHTRGGDRSVWLAAGARARANLLGRTCSWCESFGHVEAAGTREHCWREVSLGQVAP